MDNNIETAMAEANPVSAVVFSGTFLAIGYGGYALGTRLGLAQGHALMIAACACVFYFGWLLLKRNGAVVDDAIDKANEALTEANDTKQSLNEVVAIANAYKSKLAEAQTQGAQMQSLQLELQTLKEQKQSVDENLRTATDRNVVLSQSLESEKQARDKDKANADTALASAKLAGEQAVATAKVNAKKSYAPAIELYATYMEYKDAYGIANNNSLSPEEKQEGSSRMGEAKKSLDKAYKAWKERTQTATA